MSQYNNSFEMLRCPKCAREGEPYGMLDIHSNELICKETSCRRRYPIVDGLPIMLTEDGDYFNVLRTLNS